ncbi:leucine-rich repeat domain-containing protein [Apilactobacillus sp. HBW1]|uniref:Leucine-rich repeat domain-containing protein n=1 Tax=Apilactobacillus waqarii TaxID=2851006 RepID=A0ABS6M491_9LACO|nr:leucine-rich repeat domain-containing protein [Apilactobacillus waqarii]MBV0914650.1 leucine-rich repeat domain-containing protein [Apilactobacillus waqarii]
MKKTSLKTALLFSTLVFGTVQANALINQSNNYSIVAHADSSNVDTSTTNIATIKDNTIRKILLSSVNSQEHTNYSDASQITNDDLAKLTSINYNGNGSEKVSSLDNFNTSILPNITSFSIDNVDVSGIKDLSPFVQWNKLSSVSLSGDNITSEQFSTLGKWSDDSLTYLDLSHNNISNLDFLKNIQIPNVQSIDVNHNQISDFTPVVTQQWNSLTDLNAGFNKITDISPIAKVNWPSLQNLIVESNQISDISVIASANWPNLQTLNADNNNISDINAFATTNWHNLKVISAAGNKIQNVNALAGKAGNYKNLQTFIVNNNNINDISWMSGFKFNSDSLATDQTVNDTQVVVKPENGQSILVPVTIKDVTLTDGVNWTYLAADDNAGTNLEASNISDSSATIIGNDGLPFKLVKPTEEGQNTQSNGIKGVKLNYTGANTSTVSFDFGSNFGISQPGYFGGRYTLNVNWATANSQSKTVKVTVNYVDQDGKKISAPQTQTVNFVETGKKVDATGQQIWNNDWKALGDNSYSFSSPEVKGYELANNAQSTVSGNVNNDSSDITENVVYKTVAPSSSADSNASKPADSSAQSSASSSEANSSSAQSSASSSEANSSSTQSSAQSSEANSSSAQSSASSSESSSSSAQSSASSSEANSSSAQSSVTNEHSNNASNPTQSSSVESSSAQSSAVSNNGNNAGKPTSENSATPTTPATTPSTGNNSGKPNKEVTIKHVDPAVPGHKNNASHPATENKNKLPQTGDKTEQNVLVSLGVVAIATALGLAAFALRRKNK